MAVTSVAASALVRTTSDSVLDSIRESSRVRKDLRPAIYVMADVAGAIESPVYAMLAMNKKLDAIRVNGASIARYNAVQPDRLDQTAIKWDGEWQLTIEVLRDLGLAFAVVLVLIYVLVVGWFRRSRCHSSSWRRFRSP